MFNFNHDKFFLGYINRFGPLKTDLAESIQIVMDFISADERFSENPTDRYKIAYILATFKWETAHTFKPIDEYGSNDYFENKYGYLTKVGKRLGNTNPGYVQLTGRFNYKSASDQYNIDLINQPDLAKGSEIAYKIAVDGMINGSFTGKKLSNFFKPKQPPNYDLARSIINGTDQYQRISDIARRFDEVLMASIIG
jgi:putative chitinase